MTVEHPARVDPAHDHDDEQVEQDAQLHHQRHPVGQREGRDGDAVLEHEQADEQRQALRRVITSSSPVSTSAMAAGSAALAGDARPGSVTPRPRPAPTNTIAHRREQASRAAQVRVALVRGSALVAEHRDQHDRARRRPWPRSRAGRRRPGGRRPWPGPTREGRRPTSTALDREQPDRPTDRARSTTSSTPMHDDAGRARLDDLRGGRGSSHAGSHSCAASAVMARIAADAQQARQARGCAASPGSRPASASAMAAAPQLQRGRRPCPRRAPRAPAPRAMPTGRKTAENRPTTTTSFSCGREHQQRPAGGRRPPGASPRGSSSARGGCRGCPRARGRSRRPRRWRTRPPPSSERRGEPAPRQQRRRTPAIDAEVRGAGGRDAPPPARASAPAPRALRSPPRGWLPIPPNALPASSAPSASTNRASARSPTTDDQVTPAGQRRRARPTERDEEQRRPRIGRERRRRARSRRAGWRCRSPRSPWPTTWRGRGTAADDAPRRYWSRALSAS